MTRKQTRRKHYNTEPGFCAVTHAILGAAVTDKPSLDRLRLVELSAIDAFSHGRASKDDWKAIADLLNVAETMCDMGIGTDETRLCLGQVEAALLDSFKRFEATGRVGITGPGLNAMRELHEWHDAQRTAVARSVYERAILTTLNRIRSAHPGNKVLVEAAAGATPA